MAAGHVLEAADAQMAARVTAASTTIRRFADCVSSDRVFVPGLSAETHLFWLFPLVTADPISFAEALRRKGIDASRGSTQLAVVQGTGVVSSSTWLMNHVTYVPVSAEAGEDELDHISACVKEVSRLMPPIVPPST